MNLDKTIPTVSSFFFLSFLVLLSNAGVGLGVGLGSPHLCLSCPIRLFEHIIPVIAMLSSMKIVLEILVQRAYRRGFTK